jgi:hypothetical protein
MKFEETITYIETDTKGTHIKFIGGSFKAKDLIK